jgi:hypothetical protein
MSGTRQHVHELIDQLPSAQLSAVAGLLEAMIDPVAAALRNAPIDDEPFTEEDRQAVAEADEWSAHNKPIPLENVLADFGLTLADWETMGKTPLPRGNGKPGA